MDQTTQDNKAQETQTENAAKSGYELVQHIEAILFWKGDPMSVAALAKITGADKASVITGLGTLKTELSDRGIVLIEHDGEFTLGTNPASAQLIETVRTEELSKDLGKASLETLAIVLYQGPIRRTEIDYIRGVNSNFILRNLLVRGLIERKIDAQDSRAAVYQPTLELLRFLGITQVAELEDFDTVKEAIQTFRAGDEDTPQPPAPDTATNAQSDTTGNSEQAPSSESLTHDESINESIQSNETDDHEESPTQSQSDESQENSNTADN